MGDEPKTIEELLDEHEQWQREVGPAFYSIRTSLNLTQAAFASTVGLSQSYVSEIENGSKVPSPETLTETQTRLGNYMGGDSGDTTL